MLYYSEKLNELAGLYFEYRFYPTLSLQYLKYNYKSPAYIRELQRSSNKILNSYYDENPES